MRIGVPKEVKNHEYRVAITPAGVHELSAHGILADADEVWAAAETVLKVKEPVASEYERMRPGQVLFAYLHLAADKALTEELLAREVTAIAYETVQTGDGRIPLLAPMSEVAGRLAPQVGAATLLRAAGGRGVLLGGVPGVQAGHVVVIGAGVAGMNAARIAVGLGARVTVLDTSADALKSADRHFGGRVQTLA